jgi:hypothetical protein
MKISRNNITVINSSRMRLSGSVERMGGMRNAFGILVGKLKERDHSEDLGVDGKLILEWILGKRCGRCGLHVSGSG